MKKSITITTDIEFYGLECASTCPHLGLNYWCDLFKLSVYSVRNFKSNRSNLKRCLSCISKTDNNMDNNHEDI